MLNDTALAFGRGSDARLRGEPIATCPYEAATNMAAAWRQGYGHCSRHWGVAVKGRWLVRELPPVGTREAE